MAKVEKSIDINVPVYAAYSQWAHFEQYPHFLEGVREVSRLDSKHLRWKVDGAGGMKEWEVEIEEHTPGRRIAWHTTSGERRVEEVSFHRIDPVHTRVTLALEEEEMAAGERMEDPARPASARLQGDLRRFKEFIEARVQEKLVWTREKKEEHATVPGREPYRSTSGSDAPRGTLPEHENETGRRGSSGTRRAPGHSPGTNRIRSTGSNARSKNDKKRK